MKRTLRASLDRIEEGIAVLITDDGDSLSYPVALLPDAKETGVYELTLEGDELLSARLLSEETDARLERAQSRLRRLFKNK